MFFQNWFNQSVVKKARNQSIFPINKINDKIILIGCFLNYYLY